MYPALAVHSALTSRYKDVETLWVGGEGGMEADLVNRAGISYHAIPAAGVHGVDLKTLPYNLLQLARGTWDSFRILREFKPDVLFFTGGYVAVPMAFAGQSIPILLYVPDIEPGLALRTMARFADRITTTATDTQSYLNKKVIVTGYPIRPDLSAWDREQARSELGLVTDKPVLLVTGGSKGARSINKAILARLTEFLELAEVIHISGQLDWEEVKEAAGSLWANQRTRYHIFPYLHEMGQALAAADLVVSRSGASALGEYPFFELPAILVPYPYAWRYQKVNADHLARYRAAVIVEDSRLQVELFDTVRVLLENPGKRERMRTIMRSLSKPDAALEIANQLVELAGE